MSDIKLFKLTNGEEIIARKQADTQTNMIVLEKPKCIRPVSNDNTSKMGIAIFPWLMAGKEDCVVNLSREHIIVETVPKETIEKNYLSRITGLTL